MKLKNMLKYAVFAIPLLIGCNNKELPPLKGRVIEKIPHYQRNYYGTLYLESLEIIVKAAPEGSQDSTFYRIRKIENAPYIDQILFEGDNVTIAGLGQRGPILRGASKKHTDRYPGLQDLIWAAIYRQ
jgi:hypothetical protein